MGAILRIAFRNLLEHRSKTLIIGIIVASGVLVMVLGNSFLDRAQAGIKQNFTDNYTGDAYIYGKSAMPVSVLFGSVMSMSSNAKTPLIQDFPGVLAYVSGRPEVKAVAGQVSGMAMFSVESVESPGEGGAGGGGEVSPADPGSGGGGDAQAMGGAILVGMDPSQYWKLFDNISVYEGRRIEGGDSGIMLSKQVVERIKKWGGKDLKPGDSIILQGFSSGGFRMRKARIIGVYEYKNESEANAFLAYADIDTARILSGLTLGGDEEVVISDRTKELLAEESEDDIFGEEETVRGSSSLSAVTEAASEASSAPRKEILADTGAWQFIIVKLKNPILTAAFVRSLNLYFAKNGIEAMAGDWKAAASPFSSVVDVVRFVLAIVILILAVVAGIIIMNTLVVSVIERTGEIGTMRALGARKGFIWRLFLTETFCITGVFGLAGVGLAGIVSLIVNIIGFKAGNPFLTILFGGPVLRLGVSGGTVIAALAAVAVLSVLAHIYPVVVALRVQPVRAMQTE
jgi:putative ABC transport system permease protein